VKRGADTNLLAAPRAALDEHTVFRSLFLAYPDALLLVDAAGRVVLANPAAADLLGYSIDELAQLDVDALVPDGVRQRHGAYREAYAHNPRARPMGTTQTELVAQRRDGSEVAVEIALSPLREHGLPLVVASIRGIAVFPRVQQALRRARYAEEVARLGRLAVDTRDTGSLIEAVPRLAADVLQADAAGVFLVEANGLDLRVAAAVGLPAEEAPGMHFVPAAGSPEHHVLEHNEPVVVIDAPAQTRFVLAPAQIAAGLRSAMIVPVTDRGRNVGLLALRSRQPARFGADEVQALESMASLLATSLQRAHSEEALSHAQRLESVGQLTGGIAHDFNNLLTVILGNLLEELPEVAGGAGQPLVAAAARAGKRGAELTSKLLAFSRRQVLQPARVDVGALLDSLAAMLRRTLDQRIRITVDTAAACPPVRADAGQLEAALLNIAINARDAMRSGGLLSFTAGPGPGRPGEVAIGVRDTGSGMPHEVRERAFEPFFTTKEKGRGTGLGLSTVYGFVRQSGGRIELDSTIGIGTTVTMHLPCWSDATQATIDGKSPAVGLPPHLHVLLVEDDADVRSVVQGFLDALGCEIEVARSAESALALLMARRFDLLLTDIALGAGMRGTELARQAQARQPDLAVLLISGFAAEMLDQEPWREGARDSGKLPWELLRKPFSREELMRALARALDVRA
jgi:PAS domain S-box-containing protein